MREFRVDLVSPPMSGHLHPILGIGRRLMGEVAVRIISTAAAQAEIAAAGMIGHAALAGADQAISAIVNPPHPVRSHPWRLHAQLRANLNLMERFRAELLDLWRSMPPDLVIADFTAPVAGRAALDRGIRWWTVTPSPCAMETPDGPPAYLGGWKPRAGPVFQLRDAAGRAAVRAFKRVVHRIHRDTLRRLGFPSVYRSDGYEAIYSPDRVFALALAELEFPRRYPPTVEFVGPVLYTPPSDVAPPNVAAGRRHVLVTLGTHLAWRRAEVTATVRRAACQLPEVEFHVSDGDRTSRRIESDGNVHRIGFVSYARDLGRYDLVVHHGGAGVLAHTLAAGVPAVIVPADYDQFDNAARVEEAGVGLCVWKAADLSPFIARALGDAAMRTRCQRLQARLAADRAEDRVAARVRAVLSRPSL